ncbi:MAG: Ig-like domain-containing protein, partial [Myxococcales bacterium]
MPLIRSVHRAPTLLAALAILGCNVPGEPVLRNEDDVPPAVVSTNPADGATGVDPELTFEATFDAPLDPRTIRGGFRLVQSTDSADPCATGTEV